MLKHFESSDTLVPTHSKESDSGCKSRISRKFQLEDILNDNKRLNCCVKILLLPDGDRIHWIEARGQCIVYIDYFHDIYGTL